MVSWALVHANLEENHPIMFLLTGVVDAVMIIGTAYVIFAPSC